MIESARRFLESLGGYKAALVRFQGIGGLLGYCAYHLEQSSYQTVKEKFCERGGTFMNRQGRSGMRLGLGTEGETDRDCWYFPSHGTLHLDIGHEICLTGDFEDTGGP